MIRKHDKNRINTKVGEFQNHIGWDQSLWIVSLILMEQIVSECSRKINKEKKFAHISTIKKFHINPQVHASLLWVAVHKKMDRCFSCIEITLKYQNTFNMYEDIFNTNRDISNKYRKTDNKHRDTLNMRRTLKFTE